MAPCLVSTEQCVMSNCEDKLLTNETLNVRTSPLVVSFLMKNICVKTSVELKSSFVMKHVAQLLKRELGWMYVHIFEVMTEACEITGASFHKWIRHLKS